MFKLKSFKCNKVVFGKKLSGAKLKSSLAAALLATGIGTVVAPAVANDLWSTTIPASSCQPHSDYDASRVYISNGAWVFRGSNTGWVHFYCPLPLSGSPTVGTGANSMYDVRILFRDTDGWYGASQVAVRLTARNKNGQYFIGSLWDSNDMYSYVTSDTYGYYYNRHDLQHNLWYSFFVSMYRSNAAQSPDFGGIDFVYHVE